MRKSLFTTLSVCFALTSILTLEAPPITRAQGSTSDLAQFWITDLTGANVVSDGTSRYRDYRLTGGDPCVSATASTKWGYAGVYPEEDCTPARHIRFYLPQEIAYIFAGCAEVDPADGRLFVEDVKRIISETLFLKSALTNGADLRFGFYCGGNAYAIKMDQNVPVQKPNDVSRRVTNFGEGAGTASLFYPSGGELYPYPGAPTSFPFNFEVTAEQVPTSKPRR